MASEINFPDSLDDDTTLFVAVNNTRTNLTSTINDSQLEIPVATTSGFPNNGFITILSNPDDITQAEAIRYEGLSETTFSGIERGAEGTPALVHGAGDFVDLTVVAAHHNVLKDAVIELEKFVGVSGSENFVPFQPDGTVSLPSDLTISGAVSVSGGAILAFGTVTGTLDVCGETTFKDDVLITTDLTVSGCVQVGGPDVSTDPGFYFDSDEPETNRSVNDTGEVIFEANITPSVGKHVLIWRGSVGNQVGDNNEPEISARFAGATLGQERGLTSSFSDGTYAADIAGFKVIDGDGLNKPQIFLRNANAGIGNFRTRGLGFLVIPLDEMGLVANTDYFFSDGSEVAQLNASNTYVSYNSSTVNFTVTKPGTYLMLGYAENDAGVLSAIRMRLNSVNQTVPQEGAGRRRSSGFIRTVSLSAGANSADMQFSNNNAFGAGTNGWRGRVCLINLEFFNQFLATRTTSSFSTNSATYASYNPLTQSFQPQVQSQVLVWSFGQAVTNARQAVPVYRIRNNTTTDTYMEDSGSRHHNVSGDFGIPSPSVSRGTWVFTVVEDQVALNEWSLQVREPTGHGAFVDMEEGFMLQWSNALPAGPPVIDFTTIKEDKITSPCIDVDNLDVNFDAGISGTLTVGEMLTATGTFTEELTVSGVPVTTGTYAIVNGLTGDVVISGAGNVTVTEEGQVVVVSGSGASGPGGGGTCYTHVQSTSAITWNVNHNLGTDEVNYIVLDNGNSQVNPDSFSVDDIDNVTITFISPQDGKATIFPCGTVVTGTTTIPDPLVVATGIITDLYVQDITVSGSGVFLDSLTVSGVPVSTGTGGGGTLSEVPDPLVVATGIFNQFSAEDITASGSLTISGVPVSTGTIDTQLLDDLYVNVTGDEMTGNLNMQGNNVYNAGVVAMQDSAPTVVTSGLLWFDTDAVGASTPSIDLPAGLFAASVTTSSGINLINSTFTQIPWDTVDIDKGGWRGDDVNQLIVPSGVSYVRAGAAVIWDADTDGIRIVRIDLNGNPIGQNKDDAISSSSTTMFQQAFSDIVAVSGGDVLTVQAQHQAGNPLQIINDSGPNQRTFFWAQALDTRGVPGVNTLNLQQGDLSIVPGSGIEIKSDGNTGQIEIGLVQQSGDLRIWNPDSPPDDPSIYDDEWTGSVLDSKWTDWDPGAVTSTNIANVSQMLQLKHNPPGAIATVGGVFQDAPSGDFTVYAKFHYLNNLSIDFHEFGLLFAEDLTNNPSTANLGVVSVPAHRSGGEGESYYLGLATQHFNAYNSFDVNKDFRSIQFPANEPIYVRARVDVSARTVTADASLDGIAWSPAIVGDFSGDLTTIDEIGIWANSTTTTEMVIHCEFFRVVEHINPTLPLEGNFVTLSGIPQEVIVVSGTGGGSASDLQDAYDGGNGTISTAGGKPFELTGTGELVAVTGTFSDGLTVGTSSSVLDNTSITTGSGIFTDSLTVSGVPISLTGGGLDPAQNQTITGDWDFQGGLTRNSEEVATVADIPTASGIGTVISGTIVRPLSNTYSPIALYLFENNLNDSSGNGRNLSLEGGNSFMTRLAPDLYGHVFTGIDVLIGPDDSAFELLGDMTLQCIVVHASDAVVASTKQIVGQVGTTGDTNDNQNFLYRLGLSSTDRIAYFAEHVGGANITYTSVDGLSGGGRTMHHLAMVRKNNEITFYVDGQPTSDGESSGLVAPTGGELSRFRIGGGPSGSNTFTGIVASVKLNDFAMSAFQIRTEYESTLSTVKVPEIFGIGEDGPTYWEPSAPPVSGTIFDEEFDQQPDNYLNAHVFEKSPGGPIITDVSPKWSLFDPEGIVDTNNTSTGLFADGYRFSLDTPANDDTWGGYYQSIGDLNSEEAWQLICHVSMPRDSATADVIRAGIFVGDDGLFNNPSTADFATVCLKHTSDPVWAVEYAEWADYNSPTIDFQDIADNDGSSRIWWPGGVYLKIGYRPSDGRIDTGYSFDGYSFKDLRSGSAALSFTPTQIGFGTSRGISEGVNPVFRFFRVVRGSFLRSNPILGRRVQVPGTLPNKFTVASGTFTQSLTISGVPVATGTSGGGVGTITSINTDATGPAVTITGAGGISTITDGNTITVSGAGFSQGFQGALMSVSSGTQCATDAAVPIGFDTVEYDTNGFFSASQPGRLTIPAGINKVKLSAQYRFQQNNDGDRRIIMRKNGDGSLTQDPSDGQVVFTINAHATEDTGVGTVMYGASPVMEVVEGDYFEPFARVGSSSTLELFSSATWWQLEVLDPVPAAAFEGLTATASGSVWMADAPPASGTVWDDEFDDGSLNVKWTAWDPGANNQLITETPGRFLSLRADAADEFSGIFQETPSPDQNWSITTKVGLTQRNILADPSDSSFVGIAGFEDATNNPTTSDLAGIFLQARGTADSSLMQIVAGNLTAYNSSISPSVTVDFGDAATQGVYLRLRYESNNNKFVAGFSHDGVSFTEITDINLSYDPAEFGLVYKRPGGSGGSQGNIEHFRLNPSTDRREPVLGSRVAVYHPDQALGGGGSSVDETQVALLSQVFGS